MIKTTFSLLLAVVIASVANMAAARDIQERRQEARQESRVEARTEARIERRRGKGDSKNNIIIIQNAMLRTVSYNGIVLLHDTGSQKFYRAIDDGYEPYEVPYGAKIVELSGAAPTTISITKP